MQALDRLRSVVANDAYAATFQDFGHYRSALLAHIKNLTAACRTSPATPALEPIMISNTNMPLAAIAYPPEHPFPVAVRRVQELEQMLAESALVKVDALTRYTSRPHGGMGVDRDHGPWVLLVDVMGCARTYHADDRAVARFARGLMDSMAATREQGRGGWDNPNECSIEKLANGLVKNIWSGDLDHAAAYLMMLHHRGARGSTVTQALQRHIDQQIAIHVARIEGTFTAALTTVGIVYADVPLALQAVDYLFALQAFALDGGQPIPAPPRQAAQVEPYTREQAETFAQALIAQGWHNDNPECVDGLDELLATFLNTQVGEVAA